MKSILSVLLIALAVFGIAAPAPADEGAVHFGLQSWTYRMKTFEQVVDLAARQNIKYVQFTGGHIRPSDSPEETQRKKALLEKNGIVAYTAGVMPTSPDKERNRRLFEFARTWGMK